MSSKLARQLRRELKAHPQKAAALGGLLLVAGYFWAPLLSGWSGGQETAAPGTTAPTTSATTASGAASTEAAPAPTKHSWRQVATWIDETNKQAEGVSWQPERNVFLPSATVLEASARHEQKTTTQMTPDLAGLALSSTIVGPRKRVALLGGKPYREGETIVASTEDESVRFLLKRVFPRSVVLEREGQLFELKLPERRLTAGDHVGGRRPLDSVADEDNQPGCAGLDRQDDQRGEPASAPAT